MNTEWRVGIGYDIHRLVDGRPLILGGIKIAFEQGLAGHSDADVVLHAVSDAILGAAGLPDIGDLFPDTDEAYKGADSATLLSEVMRQVRQRDLAVNNVDVIIHAESPKLTSDKRKIAESIASLVGVSADRVNVKAKTNEGVGPLGHAQAIACTSIASLVAC